MRRKEKNNKKQVIISLLIAAIMVSSILGYIFGKDQTNTVEYGKYKFYAQNLMWATKINNKEITFNNLPQTVEHINVSSEIISRMKGTLEIDSTYDSNSSYIQDIALSEYQLELVLRSFYNIYLRKGLTTQNEEKVPVITCNDSTTVIPVLYFKTGENETSIYQQGNCIIVEARNGIEFLNAKDRIVYGVLGIIK